MASRHADPLSDPLSDPTPDPLSDSLSDSLSNPLSNPQSNLPSNPVEPGDGLDEDQPAWHSETAERVSHAAPPTEVPVTAPPVAPRLPPAVVEAPPPPRFPLFADEVVPAEAARAAGPPVAERPEPPGTPAVPLVLEPAAWDDEQDESEDGEEWDEWDEGRRPLAFRIVGAVVLLAALVLGAWFLGQALGDDDEPDNSADDPAASGSADAGRDPVDHTAEATAEAPRTAPSTQDVDGNPTSYAASNMLDGVPETAWRAAGDGFGLKLVFTFPERTRISEVGLVNGYAKTATDDSGTSFDWYAGHRRVTQVTWNFGVGDIVRQDLEDGRALQSIEVGPVEVRKIVLKIVATTDPGQGPARRDFIAISDVLLAG